MRILFSKNRANPLFKKKRLHDLFRFRPYWDSSVGRMTIVKTKTGSVRASCGAGYGAGGLCGIYLGERAEYIWASGRAMGRAVLCGISGRLRVRFCREAPLGVDSRCLLPISRRPYGPPGLFGPPGPFGLIRSQDIMRMHYVSSLRTHQLRCTIIELSR